ncbi:SPASM domain-containing protein [bacterium]|nr:SPASM domain-containing protein [bacterium]
MNILEELDTAALISSKDFHDQLINYLSENPPPLRHHKVVVDLFDLMSTWIKYTSIDIDILDLLEPLEQYSKSQYLTLVGLVKFIANDIPSATDLVKDAILLDNFYAPANNLLNDIEGLGEHDSQIQNEYICGLPFTEMQLKTINSEDTMTFCCLQWSPYVMGSIKSKSHEDVWNGDGAKEFRKSILEGTFKYCNKRICSIFNNPKHNMIPRNTINRPEDNYISNPRMASRLRKASNLLAEQLRSPQPTHVDRPRHIFIAYDEGCNLACPSCRTQIKKISSDKKNDMDDLFERVVRPLLTSGPTLLTASGHGDPLGSTHLRDKLSTLNGIQYKDLRINLQTNGLLLNSNGWQTILPISSNLEDVRISIDAATKDTYEVVRFPGIWDDLMNSLKFTVAKRNELNFRVVINFCIQDFNFREIQLFAELGNSLNVDRINFQQLVNWGTYSADDYKQRNVVDPMHPNHREFKELLVSTVSQYSNIQLSSSLPRLLRT